MEKLREQLGRFEQAMQLKGLGYKLVVLRPECKQPLQKGWQTREHSDEELQQLLERDNCNLAIRTGGGLIVVDVDSTNQERIKWVLQKVGDSPMTVRSPSGGFHFYYRTRASVNYCNQTKLRGVYDLRTDGAFIVCPPSVNGEGAFYQWEGDILPIGELPIIKISPLRERKRNRKAVVDATNMTARTTTAARNILHPEAYCMKIPSIQGANGSAALVRVVCILRDAGRTPQQAWEFLTTNWNPVCAEPPWSEQELWHAVQRHFCVS